MTKGSVHGASIYGWILGLSLFFGTVFLFGTDVQAVTQSKSGDITVSGVVIGLPPSTPPTIDYPANNSTFDVKQTTVRGDCIAGDIVKIFRNDTFVGSTLCQTNGRYELSIDLAVAKNDLIARQYDAANQPSPPSNLVVVYYIPRSTDIIISPDKTGKINQPPTGAGPTAIANFQLTINYDYTLQGIFVGQTFRLPVSFSGGTAPYAVSIDWGDGTSNLYSRSDSSLFPTEHVYQQGGFKIVTVRVSDAKGDEAHLQFVMLVNGTASPITRQLFGNMQLVELWPVVITCLIAGMIIGAFGALGVRRVFYKRREKTKKR